MIIKKKSILEAAANTNNTTSTDTSNTTSGKQQSNQTLPKPEDVEKSKKAVKDLNTEVDKINKEVKDGPMGAFLKGGGLSENNYPGTGEDFGDLGPSDIEHLSDRDAENTADYEAWLNTPEGRQYMANLHNNNPSNDFSGEKVDFEAGEYGYENDGQNQADLQNWMNSDDGRDWMDNIHSLEESVKNKRKVIKTIKVKDLK